MQARRASRELALILFSQFEKEIAHYSRKDFENIMLKSVRILSNSASEDLKLTVGSLIDIKAMLDDYEAEHESNLSRPIGAKNKPVQIPMTDEMISKVDIMLDVAEKAILALEIAEFTTLENQSEVKNYTIEIAEQFKLHAKEVDNEIQKYANGWDISRLVKMDKDILRIAITELLFVKDAPLKVICDEAVELAKKYSTEDSSSFVNGILAKIIVEHGLKG
jgi:N utilization substance protein B